MDRPARPVFVLGMSDRYARLRAIRDHPREISNQRVRIGDRNLEGPMV
jgi:hypothetical protein